MIRPERRALTRGSIILTALAVTLILSLALSACVGKEQPAAATAPAASASVPALLADDAPARPAGEPPRQAGEQAAKQTPGQTPGQAPRQAPGKISAQAASGAAARTGMASPVRQMLESAGRTPDANQPESGFLLSVPDVIRDGEPFAVSFSADGAARVHFDWRGKTLPVTASPGEPGRFAALLPVPLDEKSKSLPLVMTVAWDGGGEETFRADIPVKKRKYPVQRLTVDSKYVTPPADVQEKIKRDREEMRAAVTTVTPLRYWSLPMKRPVPGEVTSLYGMRRVFNGKPKNPHKGVDYDAREGDPVAAMEDGVVALVSGHYYGGNTVVIDHGLGVMSAYLHLSGFNTEKGQRVTRGETIGFIGSTGRVTGPHLHLSLYVLGESVNAAVCLDQ